MSLDSVCDDNWRRLKYVITSTCRVSVCFLAADHISMAETNGLP